jgi:predicted RNase H-like HicB family nuclease
MIDERDRSMELTANVHREDGSYWAEVAELPGCFASGDSLDELFASLGEGVQLYLAEGAGPGLRVPSGSLQLRTAVLSDAPA